MCSYDVFVVILWWGCFVDGMMNFVGREGRGFLCVGYFVFDKGVNKVGWGCLW